MNRVENWLEFARQDLAVCKLALEAKIYNQACFHSRQAVEKVLKGYLLSRNKSIPQIHALDDLFNLCVKIDNNFQELKDMCSKLDKYYMPMRYPDALPGILPEGLPNEKDAQEALSNAKEIMEFVKGKIR